MKRTMIPPALLLTSAVMGGAQTGDPDAKTALVQVMRKRYVIWIPPGLKHLHGVALTFDRDIYCASRRAERDERRLARTRDGRPYNPKQK